LRLSFELFCILGVFFYLVLGVILVLFLLRILVVEDLLHQGNVQKFFVFHDGVLIRALIVNQLPRQRGGILLASIICNPTLILLNWQIELELLFIEEGWI